MSILRQRFYSPLVGPPGVSETDFLPKWLYCNGLIALQWGRQMLQFTAKVSPIHHLVPTTLNHRKQSLISGQWAESLHFCSLLSAGRKLLMLLVPWVLWVLQTSDFIIKGLMWDHSHTSSENNVVWICSIGETEMPVDMHSVVSL